MDGHTAAAVLVPAYRDATGAVRVVLIRRRPFGIHGGEVAFPGGKREPADRSLRDTALRETAEEIDVPPTDVEILEDLPIVSTLTTRFTIHPFLARIRPPARWSPGADEVEAVIELALDDLLRPDARTRERIDYAGAAQPFVVDCLRVDGVRIWGATYRILEPLLGRLGNI